MVTVSVGHDSDPRKNRWSDRDAVWVEKPCIKWRLGSRMGRGTFLRLYLPRLVHRQYPKVGWGMWLDP